MKYVHACIIDGSASLSQCETKSCMKYVHACIIDGSASLSQCKTKSVELVVPFTCLLSVFSM